MRGHRGVFEVMVECREWDSLGWIGGEGEAELLEEGKVGGEVESECSSLLSVSLRCSLLPLTPLLPSKSTSYDARSGVGIERWG